MRVDENVLKKISHDIAHLTADLVEVFQALGKVEGPFYTVPDAEILRVYQGTVHPWNRNPRKRPGAV